MRTRQEISKLIEGLLHDDLEAEDRLFILSLISKDPYVKNEYNLRRKIDSAIRNGKVMEFRKKLIELQQKNQDKNKFEEPYQSYSFRWQHAAALLIILGALTFILINQISTKIQSKPLETLNEIQIPIIDQSGFQMEKTDRNQPINQNINTLVDKPELNSEGQQIPDINEDQIILSMNYERSEYFESFIDNFRSVDIKVQSPNPSADYSHGTAILFKWSLDQKDSISLKLYNNKENNIFTVKTVQQFLFREKLGPGLYYWKLESEDDLLYMNKFTISKY